MSRLVCEIQETQDTRMLTGYPHKISTDIHLKQLRQCSFDKEQMITSTFTIDTDVEVALKF